MSDNTDRLSVGEVVYRYKDYPLPLFDEEAYEITSVSEDAEGSRCTIRREDHSIPDFPACLLKRAGDFNTRGVPYHVYYLTFADGTNKIVDVGDEDDWGNIQSCTPGDCPDWVSSVGYGNDADGHDKITKVEDAEDGSIWVGNNSVYAWYQAWVLPFTEKYSD